MIGIEEARGHLGILAGEVAAGGEPVVLTRRGQALAVLVGRDEYARLKEAATDVVRAELEARLEEVRRSVREAGLAPDAVDEAIAMSRKLG
jgi:prevent-host-death family protein